MLYCSWTDEVKVKIAEYSQNIKDAFYTHREKLGVRTSPVWDFFHEIIDSEDNVVEQFYFCVKCEGIIYSQRPSGNTTKLLRHPCVTPSEHADMKINSKEFEDIKRAAAKFVCLDLRPFNAVECTGLRELITAGVKLGKKYPQIKLENFLENFPSRNTVKAIIADEANRAKAAIKIVFKEALKQGGLGCTLDLWTDRFKSNTYIAMTANVFLLRETCIEQKSIVFHMGYVADIVKSKEVIKLRIIKVFGDFGVSVQDLKEKVTLTTDRYGILKLYL